MTRSSSTRSGGHGPAEVQATFGQLAEDAVEVELVRPHQAVGEQVQPQVRVGGVLDRVVQRADHGDHLDRTQTGQRPVAERGRPAGRARRLVGAGASGSSPRPSLPAGYQVSSTWPSAVDGGQADAPGGLRGRHGVTSRSSRPADARCSARDRRWTVPCADMENPLTPEVLADPVQLTRALVDIESVSGNEKAIADASRRRCAACRT